MVKFQIILLCHLIHILKTATRLLKLFYVLYKHHVLALLAALPDHEKGAQAILIEAECPEKAEDEAMAVRRLGFYARCGAKDTGWTEHLFDAWFRVLVLPCCGGKVRSPEEAVRQLADCYRRTMGEPQWRRNVTFYRPDGVEVQF